MCVAASALTALSAGQLEQADVRVTHRATLLDHAPELRPHVAKRAHAELGVVVREQGPEGDDDPGVRVRSAHRSEELQVRPREDLAAAQKCNKCHTATTTKKGPSWGSVAEKYKGKADAPDKLFTYLKSGGKQSDGDDHKKVEAPDGDIKALVGVVLSSK